MSVAPIVLDEATANRARVGELTRKRDRARDALEPYLERDAGAGYGVALYWSRADVASVTVSHGSRVLEALDVAPTLALEVFRHTALYAPAYRDALTARPAPMDLDYRDAEPQASRRAGDA